MMNREKAAIRKRLRKLFTVERDFLVYYIDAQSPDESDFTSKAAARRALEKAINAVIEGDGE